MRDLAKTPDIVIHYSKVTKAAWNFATAMSGELAKRFEGNYFKSPNDVAP